MAIASLLGAVMGCEPGDIVLVTPGSQASVPSNLLTVHVRVDPADQPLADSLSWLAGVPGAEVWLLRHGTGMWRTDTTDADGIARFEKVQSGRYRLFAGRTLTDAEATLVGGTVTAFGDGRTLGVGASGDEELLLLAHRSGTLLISETGPSASPNFEINFASTAGSLYFEVYNNSASARYLDGLVFGVSYEAINDWSFMPCTASQVVRTDSAGIYARWFVQFPGSGTEHPIEPGEARVVAVEAIDHRDLHPNLPDLSTADFEIGSRVNNPAVPDMLQLGPDGFDIPRLGGGNWTYLLAEAIDPAQLPVIWRDQHGREFFRVPADKIIDAVALRSIWPAGDRELDMCWPMVPRRFDRYEGGFYDNSLFRSDAGLQSLRRKVLRIAPDGRTILQNTNTSAYDFFLELVDRSPGWVP